MAGVEAYQRLSEALVEASRSRKASRKDRFPPRASCEKSGNVPCRTRRRGKPQRFILTPMRTIKAIVPLVSVYEGIEKSGKRGICRNVFHIARYGEKTEEVLTEMEKRYDLSETKLYLHGDGASWIEVSSQLRFCP